MGKTVLSLEPDYDFRLIGISCHARDYRFCWALNRFLGLDFRRAADYEVVARSQGVTASFSQYTYDLEEEMKYFTLFSNRSAGGLLIPEMKQADYLIVLKGVFSDEDVAGLRTKLIELDMVLTAFEMDVRVLRSRQNLIF